MKKELKERLDSFQVIADTREQLVWRFENSISQALPTGDYSIFFEGKSYQDQIVIERKSDPAELYSATGKERERFERELERLSKIPFKWVVCEFSFLDITNDAPPGRLETSCVYGSLISWHIRYGVPFLFLHNRHNARGFSFKLFQNFVKYKILEVK